jgi:hypothetical protein
MREAYIVINGVALSSAQSATLRSALESFRMHIAEPFALGNDDHGIAMVHAYRAHASKISDLIHKDMSN